MPLKTKLSVVTVSDYEPGVTKSWKDERALVAALSEQDIKEPFEVIMVESERYRNNSVPEDLYILLPRLQVVYLDSTMSAEMKDFGVTLASGQFIAVLESDCVPSRNWLRLLLEAIETEGYDIASGRTFYGEQSTYRRVMNLLHRSWDDLGSSGETRDISNNGAIYKRSILDAYPYPHATSPFVSAQLRNIEISNAGYKFYYNRIANMTHAIGGLDFIIDYQTNKGFQNLSTRNNRSAKMIPRLVIEKVWDDLRNCRRLGKVYLRWYDWFLLPLMILFEVLPYFWGALYTARGIETIPRSAYR